MWWIDREERILSEIPVSHNREFSIAEFPSFWDLLQKIPMKQRILFYGIDCACSLIKMLKDF
jgi:hypothetical protein